MAIYGVDYLGTEYYGLNRYVEFDASPLEVVPFGYGGLRLSWSPPTGDWDFIRLIRNSYGAPDWEDDGTIIGVFEPGDTAEFFDTELSEGRFYYYSVFVRVAHDQRWRRGATGMGLTTRRYGYPEDFFRWLPGWFQEQDDAIAVSRQVKPPREPGPLKKFLTITGHSADYLRTEMESLRWTRDPDRISGNLLPVLAQQFGVPIEPAIGMRRMRFWVRDAVWLYRRKGTFPGIQGIVTTITGWDSVVRYGSNLLKGADSAAWFGRDTVDLPEESNLEAGDVTIQVTGSGAWQIFSVDTSLPLRRHATKVDPDTPYFASAEFSGSSHLAGIRIFWLNENANVVHESVASTTTDPGGAWTRVDLPAVSPSNAAYAYLRISGGTSGTKIRRVTFEQGEGGSTGWAPPMSLDIELIPSRVNYVTNPSFEYGLMSWEIDEGSIARSEELAYNGDASLLVTGSSGTSVVTGGPYRIEYGGVRHTASIRTRAATDRIRVRWLNEDNDVLETTPWRDATGSGWLSLSSSSIAPVDATKALIDVEVQQGSRLDAAMIEASDEAGEYFDGSRLSGDYLWAGNANVSASRYFPGRAVRSARLREILPDWLPLGQQFNLRFVPFGTPDEGTVAGTGTLGIGPLGTMDLGS